MMTKLSPQAQAVLEAAFTLADNLDRDVFEAEIIAATLRATAAQIEDLYCDGDVEDSPGVVFTLRQLMLIADELEDSAK
jgi:hypothetical protein